MTLIAEAQQSIDPYLERVRSWHWQDSRAPAGFGHVASVSEWKASLEAENWEPLRHRWRNEMALARNELRIGASEWNALVRQVRAPLESWVAEQLKGGRRDALVFDSISWDLLLGWQAVAMERTVRSAYLELLKLYEMGWCPGGPIGPPALENLAVVAARDLVQLVQ